MSLSSVTNQICFISFCLLLEISVISAQGVAINPYGNMPDASALLDLASNEKGLLIPRMSNYNIENIPNPALGLLVYSYQDSCFKYFDGSLWQNVFSRHGHGAWSTSGNVETDANNFMGTIDLSPLNFRVNNKPAGFLTPYNSNTAFGSMALQATSAFHNTAMGFEALKSNVTGANNSAFGNQALTNNTSGEKNVGLGSSALKDNTTGSFNTGIGYAVLTNNETGQTNTAIGWESMYSNVDGNSNAAMGNGTLYANTGGSNNVAMGSNALRHNSTGHFNIAIGSSSLYDNSTGQSNIAIGISALRNNETGYSNIAIGRDALKEGLAKSHNVAIGDSVLLNNGLSGTGSSLYGSKNTGVGSKALMSNTSGYQNVAFGAGALTANTTGAYNTSLGVESMKMNTSGVDNVSIGAMALNKNSAGNQNTAVGKLALSFNSLGDYNTGIGYHALSDNSTGYKNTALGYLADVQSDNLHHATAIGAEAEVFCSNCLVLGGTGGASTFVGINTNAPNTDLLLRQKSDTGGNLSRGLKLQRSNGSATFWRVYNSTNDYLTFEYDDLGAGNWGYITTNGTFVSGSDQRIKKNVSSLDGMLSLINQMNPVSFHYTSQEDHGPLHYGFIAQEVESIFPDLVYTHEDGTKGIAYQQFAAIAIDGIQEQQALIDELQAQNQQLAARLTQLEGIVASLSEKANR
jgi:hypothetical protein